MIEYVWLVAGILGIVSALLDLRAEESKEETLKDLFIGVGFLSWYLGEDLTGAVFFVAAAVVYYPELKKVWIRKRYG